MAPQAAVRRVLTGQAKESFESVLICKQPTLLVIRSWRIYLRRASVLVILILRLRISLRVMETTVAAWRRITRPVGAAVRRIDVTVIGPLLRILTCRRLPWRQHDGIAGAAVLWCVLGSRLAGRHRGIGASPRMSRQRNLRRTGQRHRGVEHAILFDQRIQGCGVGARQPHAAMGNG